MKVIRISLYCGPHSSTFQNPDCHMGQARTTRACACKTMSVKTIGRPCMPTCVRSACICIVNNRSVYNWRQKTPPEAKPNWRCSGSPLRMKKQMMARMSSKYRSACPSACSFFSGSNSPSVLFFLILPATRSCFLMEDTINACPELCVEPVDIWNQFYVVTTRLIRCSRGRTSEIAWKPTVEAPLLREGPPSEGSRTELS